MPTDISISCLNVKNKTSGMASMMGMDNPPGSLNQGNPYANGYGDAAQKEKDAKDLESLKAMVQNGHQYGGMDPRGMDPRQPSDVNQAAGQYAAQNGGLDSISPATLNMFRASGSFPSAAAPGNQNPYAAHGASMAAASMREHQLLEAGMYGSGAGGAADRFSHQQYHDALAGSQYGLNPSSYGQFGAGRGGGADVAGAGSAAGSAADQAFLQSFGQSSANYPSAAGNGSAAGGGGAYGNPAFDDMERLLGMSGSAQAPSRNSNGGSKDGQWT